MLGICTVLLTACTNDAETSSMSFSERCVSYGMSEETVELLDSNSAAMLKDFYAMTDQYDLKNSDTTFEYVSDVYLKLDELWISAEYGDSYLRVRNCSETQLVLDVCQGESIYSITIPFECVLQDVDSLHSEHISDPTEDVEDVKISRDVTVHKHSGIKSDDTLQWQYMAHNAGFFPSTFVSYDDVNVAILYKLFYCYHAEHAESKDIQTLSAFVSTYNLLSREYTDWSLDVYADHIVWKIGQCDFTLYGTIPDSILVLKKRYKHVNNMAYPTDKLHLYSLELDKNTGEMMAVINKPERLNVSKLKIPREIKKYPKVVRDSLLRVLRMSKLYHLDTPIEAAGFVASVTRYIDSIDMTNGLYDCSAENIGGSAVQVVVEMRYKNKLYGMTIIPEEEYYRKEKIQ